MQRVPWMCWKRMSDNWKAYILAYAWPVPISSRILWSLLLQNHFKLNRDFIFFFLSVRELWNFIYFSVCSIGKWTSSGEESGTSVGRHSILFLSSAKSPLSRNCLAQEKVGSLCKSGRDTGLTKTKLGAPSSHWPWIFALCVNSSWVGPKEKEQLNRLVRFLSSSLEIDGV